MKAALPVLFAILLTAIPAARADDTVSDAMKLISQALPVTKMEGKEGADCRVTLIDRIEGDQRIVDISILRKSDEKLMVNFSLRNQMGSTRYTGTRFGNKLSVSLTQDDTGKQTFKFNFKSRLLTISSAGNEASCLLQ
jgi:hypothetical protein